MINENEDRQAILEAADRMISAFAQHDHDRYFDCFSEHATFLFHNMDRLLKNREEYQTEWKKWEQEDGFRVLACRSTKRHIQVFGAVAVFTHCVSTDISFGDDKETTSERETIVFARDDFGNWLGVHEHLSKST